MPRGDQKTRMRFLGLGACCPEVGGESTCYLLNDDVLVDAGWCAALHMRQFGCDPLAVRHVFITHCHQDHYLGLAPLLFWRAMAGGQGREQAPLTIVGPRTEIGPVVDRALAYLQNDRYSLLTPPEVVGLPPGEGLETDRFAVRSAQVVHPTLAVCYRFEDKRTGASIVITGDTAYHEPLGRFAAGADVLAHEASCGAKSVDPLAAWGHSGSLDAARIAQAARPKRLYLVHCPLEARQASLAAARDVFAETYLPETGQAIELPLA